MNFANWINLGLKGHNWILETGFSHVWFIKVYITFCQFTLIFLKQLEKLHFQDDGCPKLEVNVGLWYAEHET